MKLKELESGAFDLATSRCHIFAHTLSTELQPLKGFGGSRRALQGSNSY